MGERAEILERHKSEIRWIVLIFACFAMIGSYYCYDIPSALKNQLEDDLGLGDLEFNLFYTVYSVPNIILPFFGGYLVDKFGTNVTLVAFLCFILVGQFLFATGVKLNYYWLCLVGRTIFGMGGESLCVAQSTLLALWFRGKEMAFAMGLNLSIARMGSVINDYASPVIYNSFNLTDALWFGFFVCGGSMLAALSLVCVENWAARYAPAPLQQEDDENAVNGGGNNGQVAGGNGGEEISFSDVKHFQPAFWLLCFSCVIVYACVLPFNNIAGGLIQEKWGYTVEDADRVLAIPFFISAISSPFLGGAVDRFGYRALLLMLAAMAITGVHLVIAFTDWTPYIPMDLLGVAYSVYAAAIWPSVAYVVEEHQLGTAYGLITAVQNLGLAATPALVGEIKDATGDYFWVEIFFAGVAFVGVLLGIALNVVDSKNDNILNKRHVNPPPGGQGDNFEENLVSPFEGSQDEDEDYLAHMSSSEFEDQYQAPSHHARD